ncbi:MAG: DUF6320 domain-containing protein [Cyclobacteriaceae bacterium]
MINCKNCGVELDEHMNFCPVCGVPVMDDQKRGRLVREKKVGTERLKKEIDQLNRKQKKKLFWEIISIILAAGIVSSLLLNLIINKSLNWSLYVLVGGVTVFALVSIIAYVNNIILMMISSFIVAVFALLSLDVINQTVDWSVQLGIPLLVALSLIFFLLYAIVRHIEEKGFNLIAYIFLGISVLIVAVQAIISLYKNSLRLGWSLIVFFSILPIAVFLLYVHYKLRKGTNLKKFFHI